VTSIVAVVGATGTGKSALSLDLADRIRAEGRTAEIVNADAMQLYRGMDVGTAKLPVGGGSRTTCSTCSTSRPRRPSPPTRRRRAR
jgi:tRNA A37 N6-isopentenylltransferase MiaA